MYGTKSSKSRVLICDELNAASAGVGFGLCKGLPRNKQSNRVVAVADPSREASLCGLVPFSGSQYWHCDLNMQSLLDRSELRSHGC